jgi:hypothetical protein
VKSSYTLIIIGLGVAAYYLFRRAERHSVGLMVLGLVLFGGALVVSMYAHPKVTAEERKRRLYKLLDIHRPEETKQRVFELFLWLVYIFAPLLLFLDILPKYPLLDDRLYLWLLYVVPAFFLLTFLIPTFRDLRRFPLVINLLGRLGLCIPAIALVFSLLMIVNCAGDDSSQTRTVVCLAKRATRGSQPSYYIWTKPWNETERDVEVDVPASVFSGTPSGAQFQMTTGRGKLGIEWIRRFDSLKRASKFPTQDLH